MYVMWNIGKVTEVIADSSKNSGLICPIAFLAVRGLLKVFSNTEVQKCQCAVLPASSKSNFGQGIREEHSLHKSDYRTGGHFNCESTQEPRTAGEKKGVLK